MAGFDWQGYITQLGQSFNAFVQKAGADIATLQNFAKQLAAGHNDLNAKLEQLAVRQAAIEDGCRRLAALVTQGGAGAVAVGPQAQTVDAAPAGPPPPIVSAQGTELKDPATMSEADRQIFFSGDE